jgi:hypothetical protein
MNVHNLWTGEDMVWFLMHRLVPYLLIWFGLVMMMLPIVVTYTLIRRGARG